jgi:hypothetical protein
MALSYFSVPLFLRGLSPFDERLLYAVMARLSYGCYVVAGDASQIVNIFDRYYFAISQAIAGLRRITLWLDINHKTGY